MKRSQYTEPPQDMGYDLCNKEMERISEMSLVDNELYIFSRNNPPRHEADILWGVIDNTKNRVIRLESCSSDLQSFRFWSVLPAEYMFGRPATPYESLQYGWDCGFYESEKHGSR